VRVRNQASHLFCGEFRGVLDAGADQMPPLLKPGLGGRRVRRTQPRVTEQYGVQRAENVAAVINGPRNRIWMSVDAIFRVGAIHGEADLQITRREIAARGDVVAGKKHDGSGGNRADAGLSKDTIAVEHRALRRSSSLVDHAAAAAR
jgi:hypothetical protein